MPESSNLGSLFSRAEELHRQKVANFKRGSMDDLLDQYLKMPKTRAQSINGDIYFGFFAVSCSDPGVIVYENDKKARIRELFSLPKMFEKDILRMDNGYIADVLVNDAIKNNTRDDLPYFLQSLYDERVSDN